MKTYRYDTETKEYLYSEEVFLDPLETEKAGKPVYLLPADSTFAEPLKTKDGYAVVWNGDRWEYIEDHRQKRDNGGVIVEGTGTPFWMPEDNWQTPARYMTALGKLPKDAILEKPVPSLSGRIDMAYLEFDIKVEKRLDDFAKTRRYNSIYTAKAAKDSHIAKYAAEGKYCEYMWAETYNKCEELLAEYIPLVLAGERNIPTWEEIEVQLPELKWPDEQPMEDN